MISGTEAHYSFLQDILYQPVSLSCGHKFCARCALAAAIGNDRLIGNAEHLLLSVACYSTERPCPCCRTVAFGTRRQKRSPFYDIMRLTKLEELIKKKYESYSVSPCPLVVASTAWDLDSLSFSECSLGCEDILNKWIHVQQNKGVWPSLLWAQYLKAALQEYSF